MKKFDEFIKEDIIAWAEESQKRDKIANALAKILTDSFGVTCGAVVKSLVNDFTHRNDLKGDKYFGISVFLQDYPMYSIDKYIKDLEKIKRTFEGLEALEVEHAKGKIFAFFEPNEKIERAVESGKIIDKFNL